MERPILFSNPMVQAILDGRKTQTRRVVKAHLDDRCVRAFDTDFEDWHGREIKCPYGKVGDILWVRESWGYFNAGNELPVEYCYKASDEKFEGMTGWKPSIHMPKSACRIFLEITDIRVERLQDISEEDAISEGVKCENGYYWNYIKECQLPSVSNSATNSFMWLWESINGKESLDSNPFVWVVEFKRIQK